MNRPRRNRHQPRRASPRVRPAALLLALLFLPALPGTEAQGDTPLRRIVERASWDYGPETRKQPDAAAPGETTLQSGRLGSHLDLEPSLRRDGAGAPTTWSHEAALTDGTTTVTGHIPHGGTLARSLPHRPAAPATVLVEARVDTGDLLFELREQHVVRPADRDTPLGGVLVPLALLAAALAARGRHPPLRKHHIRA